MLLSNFISLTTFFFFVLKDHFHFNRRALASVQG